MKNVYYYLYYKVYTLLERTSMPWWSDFKAGFLISCIQMSLLAIIEYKVSSIFSVTGADMFGFWSYFLFIGIPPLALNYFLFGYRNKWKDIVEYFDKINPQLKNKLNLQMLVVILFVISLFITLIYL